MPQKHRGYLFLINNSISYYLPIFAKLKTQ